jgi:hypothetical protein
VTIRIDLHTRRRMPVRGISEEEVLDVLRQKKVKVVYVEEAGTVITVTAYAYYGEWEAQA